MAPERPQAYSRSSARTTRQENGVQLAEGFACGVLGRQSGWCKTRRGPLLLVDESRHCAGWVHQGGSSISVAEFDFWQGYVDDSAFEIKAQADNRQKLGAFHRRILRSFQY